MTKTQKSEIIAELTGKFDSAQFFYLTDSTSMSVAQVNKLRRICFEKGIEMQVVKNSLIQKALEASAGEKNYDQLYSALKGQTAIMFSPSSTAVAKVLKDFRTKDVTLPVLKGAYIDSDIYLGDDQLETLVKLKSKEDLLGELIGLLQSPAKNVISALKSGGSTIAGLVKALEERGA
jgi:large subunit ribosomal protein L10